MKTSETMTCSECLQQAPKQKGGRCKRCVCRALTPEPKYHWTDELLAGLRRAYKAARKAECTRQIDQLVKRTGWPRYVFNNKAHLLGLRVSRSRGWTAWELEVLRERGGELSCTKLGWLLNRTAISIKQKLALMQLSSRVTKGYSRNELAQQMGVHHARIDAWLRKGWLRVDDQDRIPDTVIRRFLFQHMDEYRFGPCDEPWLKTMLNPRTGCAIESAPTKPAQAEYSIAEERAA